MYKITLFYLFGHIYFNSASIVKWKPRNSFDLPVNFEEGILPCSQRTVIIEEHINYEITLEKDIAVAGLILPIDGEIVFGDGSISFGGPDDNCTKVDLHLKENTPNWLQADVWESEKFNKATPDAERIPCYNDDVVLPTKSINHDVYLPFALQFPDITQHINSLWLDHLKVDERIILRINLVSNFVLNKFSSTGLVTGEPNTCSKAGCPCQEYTAIDCSFKTCPKAKCSGPIKPIGNCCNICGGALTFEIDEKFNLKDFNETVFSTVESYKEDLVYHIGRLPGNKVQVVVVNRGEYNQDSVEAIYEIEALTYKHGGLKTLARTSGSPDKLTGLGLKIAMSTFFVIVSMMGGIYLYYYKLPEFRYPVSARNGILSRFYRRSDSVVSLTRRDSGVGIITNPGFRNPLYEPGRGQVQLIDEIAEHEE